MSLPMPAKVSWADIVWNAHALVMMIIGVHLAFDYPLALGFKKMFGPYKWWTLVSSSFIGANGLAVLSWIFYMI